MLSCMLGQFDVMALILMAIVASASQNCAPGTFMEADACVKCEAGKYSSQADATSCRRCPGGTASNLEGASSCTDCQPGFFAPWGSATCDFCKIGTYSDEAKSAACAKCPPGLYAKDIGSTACSLDPYCPTGYGTEIRELHGDPLCVFDREYNSE
jgi:hypothetical protein